MKGESTCRNTKALQKVENILFSLHKFRATRNKEESQSREERCQKQEMLYGFCSIET